MDERSKVLEYINQKIAELKENVSEEDVIAFWMAHLPLSRDNLRMLRQARAKSLGLATTQVIA